MLSRCPYALAPLILLGLALLAIGQPADARGPCRASARPARCSPCWCSARGRCAIAAGRTGKPFAWQRHCLFSLRLDAISATMVLLVAFVGWIVARYSRSYLDGEVRGRHLPWPAAGHARRGAGVVQAGSLPCLPPASSRPERACAPAVVLSRPAGSAARRGPSSPWSGGPAIAALILAALLLWFAFGTADIAAINRAATAPLRPSRISLSRCWCWAALLKTAAFPLHGWITEVMEAPTRSPPCSMPASSMPGAS